MPYSNPKTNLPRRMAPPGGLCARRRGPGRPGGPTDAFRQYGPGRKALDYANKNMNANPLRPPEAPPGENRPTRTRGGCPVAPAGRDRFRGYAYRCRPPGRGAVRWRRSPGLPPILRRFGGTSSEPVEAGSGRRVSFRPAWPLRMGLPALSRAGSGQNQDACSGYHKRALKPQISALLTQSRHPDADGGLGHCSG